MKRLLIDCREFGVPDFLKKNSYTAEISYVSFRDGDFPFLIIPKELIFENFGLTPEIIREKKLIMEDGYSNYVENVENKNEFRLCCSLKFVKREYSLNTTMVMVDKKNFYVNFFDLINRHITDFHPHNGDEIVIIEPFKFYCCWDYFDGNRIYTGFFGKIGEVVEENV